MTQLAFGFDPRRCVGCHACTVACAQSHGLPAGMSWRYVEKLPPHVGEGDLAFLSWSCLHCAEPACLLACPCEAYVKRPEDGIVIHLDDRCMGCQYCTWACPYGAPQYDATVGLVRKCDFCVERLEEGLAPACVETCFGGALTFGTLEELESRGAIYVWAPGLPDPGLTQPSLRLYSQGNFKNAGLQPRSGAG